MIVSSPEAVVAKCHPGLATFLITSIVSALQIYTGSMCFTEMLMAGSKDHPVKQLLNPGIKWAVCPQQHLSPPEESVTGRKGQAGRAVRAWTGCGTGKCKSS